MSFFLTGSSSYRYITLSYLDKRLSKIVTSEYTTSRDGSSNIDGAIFFKEGNYYFFDIGKKELHCMNSNLAMRGFHEAVLFDGDSISMIGKAYEKKYAKKDFSIKCTLLHSITIKK